MNNIPKLYISHRGNLIEKNEKQENSLTYIQEALNLGFHCEIDVWKIKEQYYLGHDKPDYIIDFEFLKTNKLLCHAKNIEALRAMIQFKEIHCFYHNEDDVTLTSQNYIVSYPRSSVLLTDISIAMMPEKVPEWNLSRVGGICSDCIVDFWEKDKGNNNE